MNYNDYLSLPAGAARVVDQSRFSDGSTALRIHNFTIDERGNLDSTFHVMPLIGSSWCSGDHPLPFSTDGGVLGMTFARFDGLVPEILFVTDTGIFRYAPWFRNAASTTGGLDELFYYRDTTEISITPVAGRWYPPQFEQVGNRIYFTLGDGSRAWVWDGNRLRHFGIAVTPHAVMASGPSTTDEDVGDNDGGFSVRGRVGTTDMNVGDYGAMLDGHFEYAVVLEGPDGAYSATSPIGDGVYLKRDLALADTAPDPDTYEDPDTFLRRFWLREIAKGPDTTAARILLRTHNLKALPPGTDGALHFLHRMPSNIGTEWIDDIPDGELGPAWEHRAPVPLGFYFMAWLNGSMFCFATDGNPSRCWWSEQGSAMGPVPESFMEGHWRDIYPSSGPIRGVHKARLPSDMAQPCVLVFKERSVHYVAGAYPHWDVGTLHDASGLCGPGLVQSAPDGSVVWFGGGTFWRMGNDGSIVDIGAPIREDLARVNQARSVKGSSYVDARRGEARFFVAIDDSTTCDYQFIWDFRFGGWRTGETIEASAALRIEESDLTFVAGDFGGVRTVWALNRTYPDFTYTHPTATFQTGWLMIPPSKRQPMHSTWIPRSLLLTLEERAEGTATVEAFTDWDESTSQSDIDEMVLVHPEATVPFYSITATSPDDPALYGTDVWRKRQTFSMKQSLDTGSTESLSVKIESSTPYCIVAMDVHGSMVAPPGARTPQED